MSPPIISNGLPGIHSELFFLSVASADNQHM